MTVTVKLRSWTATDVHKLRGLAMQNVPIAQIARALKRTPGAATEKARQLKIVLSPETVPLL